VREFHPLPFSPAVAGGHLGTVSRITTRRVPSSNRFRAAARKCKKHSSALSLLPRVPPRASGERSINGPAAFQTATRGRRERVPSGDGAARAPVSGWRGRERGDDRICRAGLRLPGPALRGVCSGWCGREDLNLHTLPGTCLKHARLPIPPRPQNIELISGAPGWLSAAQAIESRRWTGPWRSLSVSRIRSK